MAQSLEPPTAVAVLLAVAPHTATVGPQGPARPAGCTGRARGGAACGGQGPQPHAGGRGQECTCCCVGDHAAVAASTTYCMPRRHVSLGTPCYARSSQPHGAASCGKLRRGVDQTHQLTSTQAIGARTNHHAVTYPINGRWGPTVHRQIGVWGTGVQLLGLGWVLLLHARVARGCAASGTHSNKPTFPRCIPVHDSRAVEPGSAHREGMSAGTPRRRPPASLLAHTARAPHTPGYSNPLPTASAPQ